MEPLWSPVVATGGKRWQMAQARPGRKQANPLPGVAIDCRREPMVRRGSAVRVRQRASRVAKRAVARCACCSGWRESGTARTPRLASLTPSLRGKGSRSASVHYRSGRFVGRQCPARGCPGGRPVLPTRLAGGRHADSPELPIDVVRVDPRLDLFARVVVADRALLDEPPVGAEDERPDAVIPP